ncbi:MAG: hypothetical protein ABR499_21730 [Gemmatimonadaceae bacterium]
MSPRRAYSLAVIAPLFLAATCSSDVEPGEAGYRYNLAGRYDSDMIVRDTRYTGSMELATRRGGGVSGTMKLTSPIAITAELTGSVSGDSVTFGGPYRTPDCTGVLRGRGRIADGGSSARGTVNIDDGCVGPLAGSFTLER